MGCLFNDFLPCLFSPFSQFLFDFPEGLRIQTIRRMLILRKLMMMMMMMMTFNWQFKG